MSGDRASDVGSRLMALSWVQYSRCVLAMYGPIEARESAASASAILATQASISFH